MAVAGKAALGQPCLWIHAVTGTQASELMGYTRDMTLDGLMEDNRS